VVIGHSQAKQQVKREDGDSPRASRNRTDMSRLCCTPSRAQIYVSQQQTDSADAKMAMYFQSFLWGQCPSNTGEKASLENKRRRQAQEYSPSHHQLSAFFSLLFLRLLHHLIIFIVRYNTQHINQNAYHRAPHPPNPDWSRLERASQVPPPDSQEARRQHPHTMGASQRER